MSGTVRTLESVTVSGVRTHGGDSGAAHCSRAPEEHSERRKWRRLEGRSRSGKRYFRGRKSWDAGRRSPARGPQRPAGYSGRPRGFRASCPRMPPACSANRLPHSDAATTAARGLHATRQLAASTRRRTFYRTTPTSRQQRAFICVSTARRLPDDCARLRGAVTQFQAQSFAPWAVEALSARRGCR